MRSYRPLPALVAVTLFLVVGDLVLLALLPGEASVPPDQEMWLVYFALMRPTEPPPTLETGELRRLLEELDPAAGAVADRVTISSYTRDPHGFHLEAVHRGDGRTYRIGVDGLY